MSTPIELKLHAAIADIGEAKWNAVAPTSDPFLSYEFLSALEHSGSVGAGTGWQVVHLEYFLENRTLAFIPLYAKSHSMGEYVFDYAIADAVERAGGDYYPKLLGAIPFTPVKGARILFASDISNDEQRAVLHHLHQLPTALGASSIHFNFYDGAPLEDYGFLARDNIQYHFDAEPFESFDEFLSALTSSKRKSIKKERVKAQEAVSDIRQLQGDDIKSEHWDAFWAFYQDTGSRKWGTPYLTRAFFDEIHATMREKILLVMAFENEQPIAAALNFIGKDTLYGRYWGALTSAKFLHFELCYYQAMDYAFEKGLKRVEAGAQGEHKLARGYAPVMLKSYHHFTSPSLQNAVANYFDEESAALHHEMDYLRAALPYRKDEA